MTLALVITFIGFVFGIVTVAGYLNYQEWKAQRARDQFELQMRFELRQAEQQRDRQRLWYEPAAKVVDRANRNPGNGTAA